MTLTLERSHFLEDNEVTPTESLKQVTVMVKFN